MLSLWSNAFASYTFTQIFFSSYYPSLDSNFTYKNDDYCDDAKIEKYNHKFSKDDSDNYNCAFDGYGQIRCGDYKIKKPQYSNTDVVKKVKAHYKKLQDIKNVTKGDDFNCALDDKDDIYCWCDGSNGEVGNGDKVYDTAESQN